jgi:hypothetical protein
VDYLSIAWPGLLALAGFVALIVHAHRDYRRRHPRGRYRVITGPLGTVTLEAQHELTEQQSREIVALAHALVGPDATTSAHSRGLHRGEHADPDCGHCEARDGVRAEL